MIRRLSHKLFRELLPFVKLYYGNIVSRNVLVLDIPSSFVIVLTLWSLLLGPGAVPTDTTLSNRVRLVDVVPDMGAFGWLFNSHDVRLGVLRTEIGVFGLATGVFGLTNLPRGKRKGCVWFSSGSSRGTTRKIKRDGLTNDTLEVVLLYLVLLYYEVTLPDIFPLRHIFGGVTKEIDWNDPSVIRYHALKMKPKTVAQARRNMVKYLKNQGKLQIKHGSERMKSPTKIEEEKVDTQKEMKEVSKESGAKRKNLPRKSTRSTVKRQKIEEDAEKEDLKGYLDIVPREEFAEDVESLSTKYLIVDWKTCVLTENFMYNKYLEDNGSSKNLYNC
ncbi:hypothetical protein Tco_0097516 [Tanacetum coccineum]